MCKFFCIRLFYMLYLKVVSRVHFRNVTKDLRLSFYKNIIIIIVIIIIIMIIIII